MTNRQRRVKVTARDVRDVVTAVYAAEEAGEPSVSVAIVDDATIREVNRDFLDHDWATDAIAFAYDGEEGDGGVPDGGVPDEGDVAGEVIVSAETAAREAASRGTSARHELLLYVAHGALHLLGWDDDTPARRGAMNRRAGRILADLGVERTS